MEQIAITLPPELSIACKLRRFLIVSSPWERVILFFGDTLHVDTDLLCSSGFFR